MKKVKRIAALLMVIFLIAMVFVTLYCAITGSPAFYGIFVYDACVTVIDLCLYVYLSNRIR